VSAETERDARIIAQSFLREYPNCFRLLGGDVVTLMVEGYILRRVIGALDSGRAHGQADANVLRQLRADVFNTANRLSAEQPRGAPKRDKCPSCHALVKAFVITPEGDPCPDAWHADH